MLIPNETLDGVSSTPTSSFPYVSVGPIDFQNINFVKTKQVDYYYGNIPGVTTTLLLSQVEQTYDPTAAAIMISGFIIGFFVILGFGINRMKKF